MQPYMYTDSKNYTEETTSRK